MLHSTLPRAFLTSGLDYFGSNYYNSDNRPPYPTSFYPPPFEEHYPRVVHEHRHRVFPTWENPTSDSPPSPLDLSLKPTKNDRVQFKVENTEYDEAEKRRSYVESDNGHNLGEDDDENEEKHFVAGNVFDHVARGHAEERRGWHGTTILRDEEEEEEPRRVPSSGHARVEDEELTFENLEGSNTQLRNYPFRSDESQAWNPKHRPLTDQKTLVSGGTTPGIHFQSLQSYRQQLLLQTPHQQQQQQHHFHGLHAPMTPPSTPSPPQCPRKRPREDPSMVSSSPSSPLTEQTDQTTEKSPRPKRKHVRRLKFVEDTTSPVSGTVILAADEAASVITTIPAQLTNPAETARQTTHVTTTEKSPRLKKKHARRLKFDEDTSSPVSGTVILGPDSAIVAGDIDPAFNVVEVTDEARADLAKIENRLGPYQCRLCLQLHEDAFQLAQHRCSRIAHLEYRCPECDKRFSCPANLASHRRWHKPRHVLPPPLPPPPPSSDGNDTATRPEPRLGLEGTRSKCDNKTGKQATPKKRGPEAINDPDEPTSDDSIAPPATNHGHIHDATANSGSGRPVSYNVDRVLPGVGVGGHLAIAPLAVEMP